MAKFGFATGGNSIATKQHNTEGGGGRAFQNRQRGGYMKKSIR